MKISKKVSDVFYNSLGVMTGILFAFFLALTGVTIIPLIKDLGYDQTIIGFYALSIICSASWVGYATIELFTNLTKENKKGDKE